MIRHDSSLEHLTGEHPERPARVEAILAAIEASGGLGWDVADAPSAGFDQLRAVHSEAHIERLVELDAQGGGMLDADTVMSSGSWEAALRAAGGSIAALEAVLDGAAPAAFAIHRPPGHHAESARAMGFCLLANAAIAVRSAMATGRARRIAVIDWDVHHGNGTEEIFAADPDVLFISIHQSPLWPGSGDPAFRGIGPGIGATINLPVPPLSGDDVFLSLLEHVVRPAVTAHRPDAIVVSAGYDAHADDPLADCSVSDRGFELMAGSVARLASGVGAPVATVLEGGYDLRALAAGVVGTMRGLTDPAHLGELPVSPVSAAALDRLGFD